MKGKGLRRKITAVVLSVCLVMGIVPIGVFGAEGQAEEIPLELVEAQNEGGALNRLRIAFNRPVKLDTDALRVYATQSQTGDTDNRIDVVASDGIVAVDGIESMGQVYASQYDLTFSRELSQTGYVCLSDKVSDGAITPVRDASGNLLTAGMGQNGIDLVAVAYTIYPGVTDVALEAPDTATLTFNYETNFLGEDPCAFVTASGSAQEAQTLLATAYERVDGKTYRFTFSGALPDEGAIVLSEPGASADGWMQELLTSPGHGNVKATNPGEGLQDQIEIPYENPWTYIEKTEYLSPDRVRVTFSDPVDFAVENPAGLFTVCENATLENPGFQVAVEEVVPVDEAAGIYELALDGSVTEDSYVCLLAGVRNGGSLLPYVGTAEGKQVYGQDFEQDGQTLCVQYTAYTVSVRLASARLEDAYTVRVRFSSPVDAGVSAFLCDGQAPVSLEKRDEQTYALTFAEAVSSGAQISAAANSLTSIDGRSFAADEVGALTATVKTETQLTAAELLDASAGLFRLRFSEAVHLSGQGLSLQADGQVIGQMDATFAPVYEQDRSAQNGSEYAKTVIVQFQGFASIPETGSVALQNAASVTDCDGEALKAPNDSVSLPYATNLYAHLTSVTYQNETTIRLNFSEPVAFCENAAAYIYAEGLDASQTVAAVSLTALDGGKTYDVTFAASLPDLGQIILEEGADLQDGDYFAIGGLVKAQSGKPVAATTKFYGAKPDAAKALFAAGREVPVQNTLQVSSPNRAQENANASASSPAETEPESSSVVVAGDYEFDKATGTILAYTGTATSVTVPSQVNGIAVTAIGDHAFENKASMQFLTLPSTLTSIGDYAFAGCWNLQSFEVPASITSIGEWAFLNCATITEFDLPSGMTEISPYTFFGCIALTSIEIPASVETIGEHAFNYCNALESVTFAEGSQLHTVEGFAFSNGQSLESISFPAGLTTIGERAFSSSSQLKNVTFPDGMQSVGPGVFWGCWNLETVHLPDSITYIGGEAFYGCSKLVSIDLPNQLEKINERTFAGCTALTNPTFPDTLDCIEVEAFSGCTSLTELRLPASITAFGHEAFENCTNLEAIYVPSFMNYIGNNCFAGCGKLTVYGRPGTLIAQYAAQYDVPFSSDTGAEIVIAPYETGLTNQNITVTASGVDCTLAVTSHTFTSNGSYTFTAIDDRIGKTITKKVTISNIDKRFTISAGGVLTSYTGNETHVVVPDSLNGIAVTGLGEHLFTDCLAMESIELPETLTSIGAYALIGCANLTEIEIPASVETIGANAFDYCWNLTAVQIPADSQLTSIGGYAFARCPMLTTVQLPYSLTQIGDSAFYGCTSLQTIVVPGQVAQLNGTLRDCTSLQQVYLPPSLTSVDANTFSGCTGLTIYGYTDSYAETLAASLGFGFTAVDPEIVVAPYDTAPTNQDVTVSATGVNCTLTQDSFTFEQNTSFVFTATDVFGNTLTETVTVSHIDKVAPVITVAPYETGTVNHDITVTATTNEGTLNASSFTFIQNGSFTFVATDAAGNVSSAVVSITNIDKRFAFDDETGTILYLRAYPTSITIPEQINGVEVKIIGSNAFNGANSIQTVILPNTITEIGNNAFYGCNQLTNINLPGGLESIGQGAFSNCTALQSIELPDSLTEMGIGVFTGCTSLTEVELSAGMDTIPSYTFSGCTAFESFTFPSFIETIESGAFSGCSNLSQIFWSPGSNQVTNIKSIGQSAFQDCAIVDLVLPMGLQTVGSYAFDMDTLESVTILGQIANLSPDAFGDNWTPSVACSTEQGLRELLNAGHKRIRLTTNGSGILFTSSLVIPSDVTLTIDPGFEVLFTNGASLTVQGTLKAVGTSSSPSIVDGTMVTVSGGGRLIGGNLLIGNYSGTALRLYGDSQLGGLITYGKVELTPTNALTINNLSIYCDDLLGNALLIAGSGSGSVTLNNASISTTQIEINYAGGVAFYDSTVYNTSESRKTLIVVKSTSGDVQIADSLLSMGEDGIGVAVEAGYANDLTITGTQFAFEDHTPGMYVTSHLERDLGVLMQGAQNGSVTLTGNTFDKADFGVYAYGVTGNGAITVGTESNGNTFENSYLYAVYFAASAGDVVVSGNTINDPLETATNAGGIWLTHANGDVEVNGNTIRMVQVGITLNNTGNGTLELDGNEIIDVTNGIQFTNSGTGAASLSGNDLRGFEQQGISIIESNSTNLQITNNSFISTFSTALPVSFNLATYNSDLTVLTGNAFSGFAYNAVGIHGTMQRDLSFTGNLCVSFDLDLNGHTLNVSDTLSVVSGDVLVNGGTLNVGSYAQFENMKLILASNEDIKNVHVSDYFFVDDWSDIQFGNAVTINVNTYVTKTYEVLNGPGTNYWAPSNPDTLNGTFAKGIWTENGYCYIEYPIYNASGTVTEYRRGYVPYANVSESFGTNSYNTTTAYLEDGSVYNLPSTSSQNLGTFTDYVPLTILDEENGMYYIQYNYDRYGAPKRGYVEKNRVFGAATRITLSEHNLSLYMDVSTYQLYVNFPSSTENKEVLWTSSDNSVVEVSPTGEISTVGPGTAIITATALVGGTSDSCTIRVEWNRPFSLDNTDLLKEDIVDILGAGKKSIIHNYTPEECIDIIIDNDIYITNYCNKYSVPKAFVQTILLRELWCVNATDYIADSFVIEYFKRLQYMEKQGTLTSEEMDPNIWERTDSSTGLGQIFAYVAIEAYNLAIDLGIVNDTKYDTSDWHDILYMWMFLKSDSSFNIKMVTLEMYHCAIDTGNSTDFYNYNYSASQIKSIFSRYNGTGQAAQSYGEECYSYYEIFNRYL